MARKIRVRRDTAANWATVDPVLASGEHGYETDTKLFKIGDGETAWSALDYQLAADGAMSAALAAKAPLVSPALSGTPTVPTAATSTNTTQAASTAFVKANRAEQAAADAAQYAPSAIVGGVALPSSDLALTLSASLCVPLSIGTDGLAYGSAGLGSNQMIRTDDGFATTEAGATLAPTSGHSLIYVGRVAEGFVAITGAEALFGSPGTNNHYTNPSQVWFSTSWGSGWSNVHTFAGRVQGLSIGRPVYDAVTGGTVWAVGEYSNGSPGVVHRLWVSTNGGQAWTNAYGRTAVNGAVNNHWHGVCFDASTRRIYAAHGDAANSWFGYSADLGATWVDVPSAGIAITSPSIYHQPVVVAPSRAGIVTTPDGSSGKMGVWIVDRDSGFNTAAYVGAEDPANQYAESPLGGSEDVLYAVHPMRGTRLSAKVYITASGDGGRTWHKVYEAAQGANEYYERGIVGPDAEGRLFIHCRENATNKLFVAPELAWRSFRPGIVRADSGELRAVLVAAGAYDSAAAMPINTNGGAITAAALTATSATVAGNITANNLIVNGAGGGNSELRLGAGGGGVAAIKTNSGTTEIRFASQSTAVMDMTANELLLRDGKNLKTGTTTGSMVASASNQRLGFWGATPVVKPTAVADATGSGDVVAQLNALLARLRTIGIITS